jgi:hypothetical protein
MAKERRKTDANTPASGREGARITPNEGRPGSETNPITIPEADWGPDERELHASVRDGLARPKRSDRRAVREGLDRLAGNGEDWHYPGQIAEGLLAPEAQPVLEQLVDEAIAERAVRVCGWRSIVYRLAASSPERSRGRSS